MTSDEGRKPEGAPERSPKAGVGAPSGVDGNGPKRFSVQRKIAIVARLLRGEPLDLVARQTNVSIARLTEWRDRALAGAATALKERERDDRDDEIARLKSKVGGLKDTRHMNSWNSSHGSRGCSQDQLKASGGAGMLYCFRTD
jgi:transposase-like protein